MKEILYFKRTEKFLTTSAPGDVEESILEGGLAAVGMPGSGDCVGEQLSFMAEQRMSIKAGPCRLRLASGCHSISPVAWLSQWRYLSLSPCLPVCIEGTCSLDTEPSGESLLRIQAGDLKLAGCAWWVPRASRVPRVSTSALGGFGGRGEGGGLVGLSLWAG